MSCLVDIDKSYKFLLKGHIKPHPCILQPTYSDLILPLAPSHNAIQTLGNVNSKLSQLRSISERAKPNPESLEGGVNAQHTGTFS